MLHSQQIECMHKCVEFLNKYGSCMFVANMGFGKTHTACGILSSYLNSGQKALVIVPYTTLSGWQRVISTYFENLHIYVMHGQSSNGKPVPTDANVILTTMHTFASRANKKYDMGISSVLKSIRIVVLDELHLTRNHDIFTDTPEELKMIKSSMCVLEPLFRSKQVSFLSLTATPLISNLLDLSFIYYISTLCNQNLPLLETHFKSMRKKCTNTKYIYMSTILGLLKKKHGFSV